MLPTALSIARSPLFRAALTAAACFAVASCQQPSRSEASAATRPRRPERPGNPIASDLPNVLHPEPPLEEYPSYVIAMRPVLQNCRVILEPAGPALAVFTIPMLAPAEKGGHTVDLIADAAIRFGWGPDPAVSTDQLALGPRPASTADPKGLQPRAYRIHFAPAGPDRFKGTITERQADGSYVALSSGTVMSAGLILVGSPPLYQMLSTTLTPNGRMSVLVGIFLDDMHVRVRVDDDRM